MKVFTDLLIEKRSGLMIAMNPTSALDRLATSRQLASA
jgi:hypothetical protein